MVRSRRPSARARWEAATQTGSKRRGLVPGACSWVVFSRGCVALDMKGLCADQPFAVDAVVAEIVDINDGVDPNAHLGECLIGRRKVEKQNLLLAGSVDCFR